MKNEINGREWGKLMEQIQTLQFQLQAESENFERKRVGNINVRYDLLRKALKLNYATNQTLQYIADLGAEFSACKAWEYTGSSTFKRTEDIGAGDTNAKPK